MSDMVLWISGEDILVSKEGKTLKVRRQGAAETISGFYKPGDRISIILDSPFLFIEDNFDFLRLKSAEVRSAIAFKIEQMYPSNFKDLLFDFEYENLKDPKGAKSKVAGNPGVGKLKEPIRVYLVKEKDILQRLSGLGLEDKFISKIIPSELESKSLNFIPNEISASNKIISQKTLFANLLRSGWIFAFGLSAIFLLNLLIDFSLLREAGKEDAKLAATYEKSRSVYDAEQEKIKLLKDKAAVAPYTLRLTKVFYEISSSLQPGIFLTRVEKDSGSITIEGRAKDESFLLSQIKNINQGLSEYSADLKYSEKSGGENVSFKILLTPR